MSEETDFEPVYNTQTKVWGYAERGQPRPTEWVAGPEASDRALADRFTRYELFGTAAGEMLHRKYTVEKGAETLALGKLAHDLYLQAATGAVTVTGVQRDGADARAELADFVRRNQAARSSSRTETVDVTPERKQAVLAALGVV